MFIWYFYSAMCEIKYEAVFESTTWNVIKYTRVDLLKNIFSHSSPRTGGFVGWLAVTRGSLSVIEELFSIPFSVFLYNIRIR